MKDQIETATEKPTTNYDSLVTTKLADASLNHVADCDSTQSNTSEVHLPKLEIEDDKSKDASTHSVEDMERSAAAKEITQILENQNGFGGPEQRQRISELLRQSREGNFDLAALINQQLENSGSSLHLDMTLDNLLKMNPPIEEWSLRLLDRANPGRVHDELQFSYQEDWTRR